MGFRSNPNTTLLRTVQGLDYPPAVPNAMDDEFGGAALDTGKWTWLDQDTATAQVSRGRLRIRHTKNENRIRGIYQTAPGGSWTFRAKLIQGVGLSSFSGPSLFAAQSTTQQVRSIMLATSRFIYPSVYTTPSSAHGAWSTNGIQTPTSIYAQLSWDGSTNLVGTWSQDGRSWWPNVSVATGYTPTLIGLGFTAAAADAYMFEYEWFRRIA